MNLQNKVAWISGGTRMGLAVARVLSHEGCRIVLTYRRSRKPAEDAVKKLISEGRMATAMRCDLLKKKDIQATVKRIMARYKRLDVLVNLSSIYEKSPISNVQLTSRVLETHLKANFESAFQVSMAVAPAMLRGGGGRIVQISDWTSASARPRYKGYLAYYTSKTALKALVESLALELAPKILINAIAPGPILPPPDLTVREYDVVVKATPLGRWGGVEEIAKAVQFLIQTDFVTGETIRVDGGRHLS